MISTFQRKKTEHESKHKSGEISSKANQDAKTSKDKSPPVKNKDSNFANYADAQKPKLKSAISEKKSDHDIKVEKLEYQINEKKKKHDDYLEKKKSANLQNKDNVPNSYLKDPKLLKNKAESESKINMVKKKSKDGESNSAVNKSVIVSEIPKPPNNQRIIKPGIKHEDSDILIEKPKKTPQSSWDLRKKSESEIQVNPRTRDPKQGSELSRQAKLAAKRGSELSKSKASGDKEKKQVMKDIEDVYNLPDFPKANGSSSEEEYPSTMNKPAMQLVAEYRAKQEAKNSGDYNSVHNKNKEVDNLLSQKMVIPKESTDSHLNIKDNPKNKKAGSSQQRVTDEDFDMLLNDKGSSNKRKSGFSKAEEMVTGSNQRIDDDEFDSILNSNFVQPKLKNATPSYQVEIKWKMLNEDSDNDVHHEESKDEEGSMDESFEDVNAAFNFTDTEFDANNRDDYTVATEILLQKQVSLDEIKEEDELEETEHRRKCSIEIKVLEAKLKEFEAIQRSKWNRILLEMDETIAKTIYDFICSKFDDYEDDIINYIEH